MLIHKIKEDKRKRQRTTEKLCQCKRCYEVFKKPWKARYCDKCVKPHVIMKNERR